MNNDFVINRVRSYSSGTLGRSLNQVRNHHFVVDDPSIGEAMTPADHFLAGVSACAVSLIEMTAQKKGAPLKRIEVNLEGLRDKADTSKFIRVNMRFQFEGVDQQQAEQLVKTYQSR